MTLQSFDELFVKYRDEQNKFKKVGQITCPIKELNAFSILRKILKRDKSFDRMKNDSLFYLDSQENQYEVTEHFLFLNVDVNVLVRNIKTEQEVIDLIRCGVDYSSSYRQLFFKIYY